MTTEPPPAALTWGGVTARRMARHALSEPATGLSPAGIAGVLCGAHAPGAQRRRAVDRAAHRRGGTLGRAARTVAGATLVKTFGPPAHPGGPGRKLPGTARRWRGRRSLAPAAFRPQAGHHRR